MKKRKYQRIQLYQFDYVIDLVEVLKEIGILINKL